MCLNKLLALKCRDNVNISHSDSQITLSRKWFVETYEAYRRLCLKYRTQGAVKLSQVTG